jgi:undecaprenyl-diphosphatase
MLAASGLKIFKALSGTAAQEESWGLLLVGCLVSGVVSFIAVRWLLRYIQTHTFIAFGWYRIVLAGLILLWLAFPGVHAASDPSPASAPPAISRE